MGIPIIFNFRSPSIEYIGIKKTIKSNNIDYHLSQRTTKPTIRLVRPARTQISLRIREVWSVFTDRVCLL